MKFILFRKGSIVKKEDAVNGKSFRKPEDGKADIVIDILKEESRDNILGIKVLSSKITDVKSGSLADLKGLRVGDLIREVNGKSVVNMRAEDFAEICKQRPLRFVVNRSLKKEVSVVGINYRTQNEKSDQKIIPTIYAVPASLPPQPAQQVQQVQQMQQIQQIEQVQPPNPSVPAVNGKYDILHKIPIDEEIRQAQPTGQQKIPPEPKTGWRWRAGMVLSISVPDENGSKIAKVKFFESLSGYPDEDNVVIDEGSKNFAPLNYKAPSHIMHHPYRMDDILDVLDIFPSKFDGGERRKWRKCQVLTVSPYYIRFNFCGWSEHFDIWIHALQEAERLADFGQYTERQQVEETNREIEFRRRMQAKGFRVFDVSPDGNCLFRAISVLLYGDQEHHKDIRKACCDYLEKESKRFEFLAENGDFPAYISHMRNLAVWADEPELRAIEELYDRPISMFSCDIVGINENDDFTEPIAHYQVGGEVAGLQDTEPLRLSFHGNNHYNAVIKVGAPKVYDPHPEKNKGRIRTHRVLQGAGSMSRLRPTHSSSMKRSNSNVSNIGK